jgi:hypothetical protein
LHHSNFPKDIKYLLLLLVKSSLHIDSKIDLQHKSFSFDVELKKKNVYIYKKNRYMTNYIKYQEMLRFDNRKDHSKFESWNILHDSLNIERKYDLSLNNIIQINE